ncbi:transposable element Tcb2 transposase [Trichonephila clavipes]|nr:transposable element Tcb2 transposase [Trichonephila clavipes]
MDDNCRPYGANLVEDFRFEEGIARMEWPACSPDMNPIEHVWDALGRRVAGRQPPPQTLQELERALLEEWDRIPQLVINSLIEFMPQRCSTLLAYARLKLYVKAVTSKCLGGTPVDPDRLNAHPGPRGYHKSSSYLHSNTYVEISSFGAKWCCSLEHSRKEICITSVFWAVIARRGVLNILQIQDCKYVPDLRIGRKLYNEMYPQTDAPECRMLPNLPHNLCECGYLHCKRQIEGKLRFPTGYGIQHIALCLEKKIVGYLSKESEYLL